MHPETHALKEVEYLGATPLFTIVDGYDAVGNRITRNLDGNPITWTYDDLYRLTGQAKAGQVCTYTLDGVGNLLTMWEGGTFPKTFTFNSADRLVTMTEGANLTTYAYTGYGALESEITGNSTTAYAYSGQDQLILVTPPSGFKSTYTFDGDGLRRTAQEGNVQPTTMVWDGSDYLLLNEPGANRVVLTLGSEILACGNRDLLTDPLGSLVKEISAGASLGSLVEMYPYGQLVPGTAAPTTPYVYIAAYGYYNDSLERDYVRARELMKKLARWMQADPVWPHASAYQAVGSSPASFVDPTGLLKVGKSCANCTCRETISRALQNACSKHTGLMSLSDREWKEVFACAVQMAKPCVVPDGFDVKSLRDCMTGNCQSSSEIECSTCGDCAKSMCDSHDSPGTPAGITICTNLVCTAGGGWNSKCGCQVYGPCPSAIDSGPSCLIMHEIAHSCGFCGSSPDDPPMSRHCKEWWPHSIACCINKVLHRRHR